MTSAVNYKKLIRKLNLGHEIQPHEALAVRRAIGQALVVFFERLHKESVG